MDSLRVGIVLVLTSIMAQLLLCPQHLTGSQ